MNNPLDTRKEYRFGALLETDVNPDPVAQLRDWLEVAARSGIQEPNAMSLGTVGAHHRPSSRMVLLRDLDARGLTFFTNYESRKGHEIDANPYGCVNFWWGSLERQVRVEGTLERVSEAESDAYFSSRPYESQAASAASPQSQPITRAALEARVEELRKAQPDRLLRPAHWGGFRLVPDRFEFWQGRPARLHDRILYRLEAGAWLIERLAP